VARRPKFVLTNVALPTLLISCLSFVPFCLDPVAAIADRFALLFALVLTTVAFKSTIATMVPAIAYLTWLDKYVMVSSCCVFLSVLASALTTFVPPSRVPTVDVVSAGVLAVFMLATQVYFGWRAYASMRAKLTILSELSTDASHDAGAPDPSMRNITRVRSQSRMRHSRLLKLSRQNGSACSLRRSSRSALEEAAPAADALAAPAPIGEASKRHAAIEVASGAEDAPLPGPPGIQHRADAGSDDLTPAQQIRSRFRRRSSSSPPTKPGPSSLLAPARLPPPRAMETPGARI